MSPPDDPKAFPRPTRPLTSIGTKIVPPFLVYSAAHLILKIIFDRIMPRKMKSLSTRDAIYVPEKILSSVNGLHLAVVSILIVFIRPTYDESTITPYPDGVDDLMASLCGYSIYDMITMWAQKEDHYSLWIHHVVNVIGSVFLMRYRITSFYPMLFSFTEISVLFNNILWYVDIFLGRNTVAYGRFLLLRAIAFPATRLWVGPYALYRAINAPGDSLEAWKQVPPFVTFLTIMNVTLISAANAGWSWAMIKIYYRWAKKGKAKKK